MSLWTNSRRPSTPKLRGHYQYYGRPSNSRSIWQFYRAVCNIWRKWLSRRTRGKALTWEKYVELLHRHPLLLPRIAHSWNWEGVASEEPAAWKSARWDL